MTHFCSVVGIAPISTNPVGQARCRSHSDNPFIHFILAPKHVMHPLFPGNNRHFGYQRQIHITYQNRIVSFYKRWRTIQFLAYLATIKNTKVRNFKYLILLLLFEDRRGRCAPLPARTTKNFKARTTLFSPPKFCHSLQFFDISSHPSLHQTRFGNCVTNTMGYRYGLSDITFRGRPRWDATRLSSIGEGCCGAASEGGGELNCPFIVIDMQPPKPSSHFHLVITFI